MSSITRWACRFETVRWWNIVLGACMLAVSVRPLWEAGTLDLAWTAAGTSFATAAILARSLPPGNGVWMALENARVDARLLALTAAVTVFVAAVFLLVPSGLSQASFLFGGVLGLFGLSVALYAVQRPADDARSEPA